jgi:demethylspheroidene O-methyltransferase
VIDRWLAARDRLLTSPAFQRWASSVPGLRWIARRRARAVFDVVAGFVYSQVLHACVKLDIFEQVAALPLPVKTLAERANLTPEACETLIAAAISLRLLERRGGGLIGLGALGAPLVGNAGLRNLVLHHALFYADLTDPLALLRGQVNPTQMANYWPYASTDSPAAGDQAVSAQAGTYSALMTSTQTLIANEVLTAYRFDKHQRLLDVGGGEGEFIATVGARFPALQLMLFDLPPVVARAQMRLNERGLGARSQTASGDFFNDPLPQGADIITLVRVMHDHDDARISALLRNIGAALPVGGTLLVAEPMADTPGAEPVGDAYFGLYFLAMGRGKARTFEQMETLLSGAGFVGIRQLPTRMPLQTSVVVATKSR